MRPLTAFRIGCVVFALGAGAAQADPDLLADLKARGVCAGGHIAKATRQGNKTTVLCQGAPPARDAAAAGTGISVGAGALGIGAVGSALVATLSAVALGAVGAGSSASGTTAFSR